MIYVCYMHTLSASMGPSTPDIFHSFSAEDRWKGMWSLAESKYKIQIRIYCSQLH